LFLVALAAISLAARSSKPNSGRFGLILRKRSDPAHLNFSPVQSALRGMPEDGFGRCDSHHEMVDFRLEKATEPPLIPLPQTGFCRLPMVLRKRSNACTMNPHGSSGDERFATT
jgi:hypothetical protein